MAAFAVYSAVTTANYRQLRSNELAKTVAFEGERLNKAISDMENKALGLALGGQQFHRSGRHSDEFGASISIDNFKAFRSAVGGGIWFEPYALGANKERVCYYAFYDASIGRVRHDPDFASDEYDYHNQMWYTTIAARIDGKHDVVWTPPYRDAAGTNSLMTTVGAGIYDENDRFIGMSTVDWQIQSVVDRLSAIRPTENSFVLLASQQDDYIISNTHLNGILQAGSSLQNLNWSDKLHFADDGTVSMGRFADGGVDYVFFGRMFHNGWVFSVQIPAQEIFAEIETRNNQFIVIITVSALTLLLLSFYLLSRFINNPLQRLTTDVAELGGGNLDKQIEIRSRDEIGSLAAAFNKMTVDLKASIEQNARERAEKERISTELNVARHIQASMLPSIFPPFPDRIEFDIYAIMQPAKEVGGDFYDFFMVDDNTLAVVIADVSGKGVPAALFMVIARTLIKNNAQYGKNPEEVFATVNNLLCENNEQAMFVTAFLGYLDTRTGKFTYANAGHNAPLLFTDGGFDWLQAKRSMALAVMKDARYGQGEIILQRGDRLFLYTDGVTEAMNRENELFDNHRLLDAANRYCDHPQKELILAIKGEVDEFAGGAEQSDDVTMLALRYNGLLKESQC